LDEYQLNCNPIEQYFNERLEKQSEDVFTPTRLIYEDYQKWCSNKGLKFENDVYFGKKIKEKFGDIKQYTRSGNVYKGIKLVS
jgi:phage/plasmid-associated DNA primase